MPAVYRIITVHGTNAGDTSLRGAKWWQKSSTFQKIIWSYLDYERHRIEWISFPWSGENSEKERRKAAGELTKKFEQIDREGGGTTVAIGHSHGGNVVRRAHMSCFKKTTEAEAARFTQQHCIAVGTPFFGPTSGPSLQVRTMAVVSGTLLLLAAIIFSLKEFWPGIAIVTDPLAVAFFVYAFGPPTALGWAALRRRLGFNKARSSGGAESAFTRRLIGFHQRCICVYSTMDEAINGLRAIAQQPIRVASTGTTRLPTTLLTAMIATVSLIILKADVRLPDLSQAGIAFGANEYRLLPDAANWFSTLSVFAIGMLIGFLFSRLGGAWLVAWALNGLFKSNFLARAYGRDVGPLAPMDCADSNPPLLPREQRWQSLPLEFDQLAGHFVDSQAADTLRSAREALGVAAITQSRSLIEALAGSVSWRELIHTSYFEIEEFAEFIAWLLVEKAGFPASRRFDQIDGRKYERWFGEICPTEMRARAASDELDTVGSAATAA